MYNWEVLVGREVSKVVLRLMSTVDGVVFWWRLLSGWLL